MCAYIGIEDLAANAMIEIMNEKKEEEQNFVSYNTLEKYGLAIVKLLSEQGEEAVLILSREETRKMLRDYSDIFVECKQNGVEGIMLRENVTIDDLIVKFRGYLSLDVLLAFMAEKTKKILPARRILGKMYESDGCDVKVLTNEIKTSQKFLNSSNFG